MNNFTCASRFCAKVVLSLALGLSLFNYSQAVAAPAPDALSAYSHESAPGTDAGNDFAFDCFSELDGNEVYLVVDKMPSFPGGDAGLSKYLAQNIKYPLEAQEEGVQGRVFVKFVIEADGSITHVKVARPFDPYLDWEAVRVVKSMPNWTPGKQDGKAVRVSYTVPINFVLQ